MDNSKKAGFNKRSLITFIMLISLLILPISGIVIHLLGALPLQDQTKHAFMSIHNVSSIIFIISSVIHISLNLKAIKNYLILKINEGFRLKKEILISFIIVVGIVALFTSHVFHEGDRGISPMRQQNNEQPG